MYYINTHYEEARMPRAKCVDHGNLSLAEINQRRTLAPIFGSQLARLRKAAERPTSDPKIKTQHN